MSSSTGEVSSETPDGPPCRRPTTGSYVAHSSPEALPKGGPPGTLSFLNENQNWPPSESNAGWDQANRSEEALLFGQEVQEEGQAAEHQPEVDQEEGEGEAAESESECSDDSGKAEEEEEEEAGEMHARIGRAAVRRGISTAAATSSSSALLSSHSAQDHGTAEESGSLSSSSSSAPNSLSSSSSSIATPSSSPAHHGFWGTLSRSMTYVPTRLFYGSASAEDEGKENAPSPLDTVEEEARELESKLAVATHLVVLAHGLHGGTHGFFITRPTMPLTSLSFAQALMT